MQEIGVISRYINEKEVFENREIASSDNLILCHLMKGLGRGELTGEKRWEECLKYRIKEMHFHFVCVPVLYDHIRGSLNKFPDFFRMGTFMENTHMKLLSPRSNLLWLQCTCCSVPTNSGRSHGSPLVWACQWPSSQPLSSPQLSHNDSLWA